MIEGSFAVAFYELVGCSQRGPLSPSFHLRVLTKRSEFDKIIATRDEDFVAMRLLFMSLCLEHVLHYRVPRRALFLRTLL